MPLMVVATKAGVPPQFQPGRGNAPAETPPDQNAPPPDDMGQEEDDGDQGREWSGDPFTEGEPSDPADAFASFSSPEGDEAWLDKAEDGTLTGWVRNAEGEVWRYTDADAWAVDVDDAGMVRSEGGGDEPDDQEGEEDQPDEEQPPADEEADQLIPGMEKKHLPGQHDQSTHGHRYSYSGSRLLIRAARSSDVVPSFRGRTLNRGRSPGRSGRGPGGGSGDSPSGRTKPGRRPRRRSRAPRHATPPSATPPTVQPPPKPPAPAPPKPGSDEDRAKKHITHLLSPERETVGHRDLTGLDLSQASDGELDGLLRKATHDPDASMAIADEMDRRDGGSHVGHIPEESPGHHPKARHEDSKKIDAAHAFFQSSKKTEYQQAREDYQHWLDAQMLRAEEATNGYMLKKQYKDRFSNEDLFNGRVRQRDLPRYATEELLRWFAERPENRWMNFTQFAADVLGWDRKRIQAAEGRRAYLSEFG